MTAKNKSKGARRGVTKIKSPSDGPSNGRQLGTQIMKCPVYRPVYKFNRVVEERYDIATDGINPSLNAFVFTLDQLPDYTDFTRLFDMYRITKVEIDWVPEYTELTDAALVSNAVNVRFNSTVDLSDAASPASVDEVLQYQQLISTGITKAHKRSWVPTFLMGGLVPCTCWLPTSSPSERHYGLKVAIPPTGVAMTFRSRCRLYVECANVS